MTKQKRNIIIVASVLGLVITTVVILGCIFSWFKKSEQPKLTITSVEICHGNETPNEIEQILGDPEIQFSVLINSGEDISSYQVPAITWAIIGNNLECSVTSNGLFKSGSVLEKVKVRVTVKGDNQMSDEVCILVNAKNGSMLQNIRVESSTTPEYIEGQEFDPMSVKLWADFGTYTARVTNFDYPQSALTLRDNDVILSYGFDSIRKNIVVPIIVHEKTLQEIKIKTLPNKTSYIEGEIFDSTGMVIVGNYEYVKDVVISDYIVRNGSNILTPNMNTIVISYAEGEIVKEANLQISVTPKTLQSITLDLTNVKREYIQGQNLDITNLIVIANYEVVQKTVLDYELNKSSYLKTSDTEIVVSYTENGITKYQSFAITVFSPYSEIREVVLENPYDALLTWIYTYYDNDGNFHSDFTELNIEDYDNLNLGYDAVTGIYRIPVGAEVTITAINPIVTDFLVDGANLGVVYPDTVGKFILKSGTDALQISFKKILSNKLTVRFENGITGMSKAFIYPSNWNAPMRTSDLSQISQIYTDDNHYYFVYQILDMEYRFNELSSLTISDNTLISVKREEIVETRDRVRLNIEYYNDIVLSVVVDKLVDNPLLGLPQIERVGYSFDGYFYQNSEDIFDANTFTSWLLNTANDGSKIYAKYTLNVTPQTGGIVNTWYSQEIETSIGMAVFSLTFSSKGTYSYLVQINGEKNCWFNGVYNYDGTTVSLLSLETDMLYLPIDVSDITLQLSPSELIATMYVMDGVATIYTDISLGY